MATCEKWCVKQVEFGFVECHHTFHESEGWKTGNRLTYQRWSNSVWATRTMTSTETWRQKAFGF